MKRTLLFSLLLCLGAAPATGSPRTHLLVRSSAPGVDKQELKAAVVALRQRAGRELVSGSARQLRRHANLRRRLRRARALLAEATDAVQGMRYPRAVKLLRQARAAADAGLARLVATRLLAGILRQLGIAQLPLDPAAARRALALSFALRPDQPIKRDLSPKLRAELRAAAAATGQVTTPTSWRLAARAARLLGDESLLLVEARRQGEQVWMRLGLQVPDREGWRWQGEVRWRRGAAAEAIEAAVARGLRGFPRQVAPASASGQTFAWIAAGTSAALALTGGVLAGLALDNRNRAEGLAGRNPLAEYAEEAEGLEAAGERYQQASIVTFVLAGLALSTAVVLWVWPTERTKKRTKKQAVWFGPGSVRVAVDLL